MTREEAINMIKALIGTYITCHGEEDTIAVPLDNIDIEAFDMAIKLLEQEPCEDAINRQALLNMYECLDEDSRVYAGQVVRDVKALPPVTPTKCIATVKFSKEDMQKLIDEKMKDIVVERKKGKWIFHEKSVSTGFRDLRECSCCRCYFRWEMPRNSYCPNCGAEMESEE